MDRAGEGPGAQRLATGPGRGELGPGQGLSGGPDGTERVGLGAVAALGPLGPVELDDQLLAEVAGETCPVATCASDGPGPQARVLIGEGHELGIAVGGHLDRELTEHAARSGAECGRAVGSPRGCRPQSRCRRCRTDCPCVAPFPEGRGSVPVRAETGRTVMGHANRRTPEAVKLLIRAEAPTGPGPATTNGQVIGKARSQSDHGSRSPSPTHSPATSPGCGVELTVSSDC